MGSSRFPGKPIAVLHGLPVIEHVFRRAELCAQLHEVFKQVCVIPFRRECLREFTRLPPTPLEAAESIDMLRLLEHGRSVRLVETEVATQSVDTPADLQLVEKLMNSDPLIQNYADAGLR